MYATLCLSVRYAQQVKLDSHQVDAMFRARGGQTGGVRVLQLWLTLDAQYRQFLDKNVRQYLIYVHHVLSMSERWKSCQTRTATLDLI
jgi:hypothetical protein